MVKLYWDTTDGKIVYLNGYISEDLDEGMISDSQRIASLLYTDSNILINNYMQYVKPQIGDTSEYGYIDSIYDECNPWCVFVNYDNTILDGPKRVALGNTPVYEGKTPTRDGYKFIGWNKEITPISANTIYTADFVESERFKVKFLNYDNSLIEEKTYDEGDMPSCSITPTKPSDNTFRYTFSGWDHDIEPVTANTNYKATYQYIYINYTINFYNDELCVQSNTLHYGDMPAYTGATITKIGHRFTGWSPAVHAVTGNQDYIAQFEIIQYKATFKNGNTILQESDVTYGSVPVYSGPTPVSSDTQNYEYLYEFNDEWNPTLGIIQEDTVFTPVYIETKPTYTITFNLNGHGSMPKTALTYNYNEILTSNRNYNLPTDSSYIFEGWSNWPAEQKFNLNTVGGTEKTLNALWTEKTGSITMSVDKTNIWCIGGEQVVFTIDASDDWGINFTTVPTGQPIAVFTGTSSGTSSVHSITGTTLKNNTHQLKTGTYKAYLLDNTAVTYTVTLTQEPLCYLEMFSGSYGTSAMTVNAETTSAHFNLSASTEWSLIAPSNMSLSPSTGTDTITTPVTIHATMPENTSLSSDITYKISGTTTHGVACYFEITQNKVTAQTVNYSFNLEFDGPTQADITAFKTDTRFDGYDDVFVYLTVSHNSTSTNVKLCSYNEVRTKANLGAKVLLGNTNLIMDENYTLTSARFSRNGTDTVIISGTGFGITTSSPTLQIIPTSHGESVVFKITGIRY